MEPRRNKCQRNEHRQSTTPISVANEIPSMRPNESLISLVLCVDQLTSCTAYIRPQLCYGVLCLFHFISISIFNQINHKRAFRKILILKRNVTVGLHPKSQAVQTFLLFALFICIISTAPELLLVRYRP